MEMRTIFKNCTQISLQIQNYLNKSVIMYIPYSELIDVWYCVYAFGLNTMKYKQIFWSEKSLL